MKILIKDITDYLDHLLLFEHLEVCLCAISSHFSKYFHILNPYNGHNNPYCTQIKSCKSAHQICLQKQQDVLKRSKNGLFFGTCYFGVSEYVFPINHNEELLGFISVSGYRNAELTEKTEAHLIENNFDTNRIGPCFRTLKTDIPSIERIRPLITPLARMLELLYLKMPKYSDNSHASILFCNLIQYLCNNYSEDISLDSLEKKFGYTKSYLRQLFHKRSGISIIQYLTDLRMKRAVELLTNTSNSIAQIADSVGYHDPNHFTQIFKGRYGVTPREYRKNAFL